MNNRNKKKTSPSLAKLQTPGEIQPDTAQTSPEQLPFLFALSRPLCFLQLADIHWPWQRPSAPL